MDAQRHNDKAHSDICATFVDVVDPESTLPGGGSVAIYSKVQAKKFHGSSPLLCNRGASIAPRLDF